MMQVQWQTSKPRKRWYQFMLDIAWPELMIIGIVAVVAIGPKDLPKVMHAMGRWAGKARHMAHDVQRSIEQLSYEADMAEKLKANPPANPHAHPHAPSHAPAPENGKPHDHLGSA
jgi:sec-independent protein translocase protein TatB